MANELTLNNSVAFELTLSNPLKIPAEVNDATVTVTVFDSNNVEVTGQAWPLTLDYVASSAGIYRKTVPPISGLNDGEIYHVVYSTVGSDSLKGESCLDLKADSC
jgi:hypothetical protein